MAWLPASGSHAGESKQRRIKNVMLKTNYSIPEGKAMKKSDISEIDIALRDLPAKMADLIRGSLDTKDLRQKIEDRNALVQMGKAVIPLMHGLLTSENDLLREEVARIVELIADRRSIPFFIQLLDDNVFEIRWIAAEGLIKTGRRSITPLLKSVRDGKSSFFFNKGIHHVLINLLDEEEKNEIKPLLMSLEDSHGLGETAPVEAARAIELLSGRHKGLQESRFR